MYDDSCTMSAINAGWILPQEDIQGYSFQMTCLSMIQNMDNKKIGNQHFGLNLCFPLADQTNSVFQLETN